MKTNLCILALALLYLIFVSASQAAERKPISEVDQLKLIKDTQVSAASGTDHMNFVWWMPYEFWEITVTRDSTMTTAMQKAFLELVRQYSVFMICQADISDFGAFRFYTKDEIAENLDLTHMKKSSGLRKIPIAKVINPNLKLVLAQFTPILTAAMGEMGKNCHLYVARNVDSFEHRQIDPYKPGSLNVRLSTRSGILLKTKIELPLDSLHVPRKCPNGKNAHVTWKYCPWTGKMLPE